MGGKGSGRGSGGFRKGGITDHPVKTYVEPPKELQAEHPIQLLPNNPMNKMELMTVEQMADMINAIDPEEKVKRINYLNLSIMAISKHADRNNIRTLQECFEAYVSLCSATGMPIGNLSAYASFGMSKCEVDSWDHSNIPERREFIRAIKKTCSMSREMLGSGGTLNPVLTIFWQKNYDGLRDQQEHVIETPNPLGERQNADQIREKYQGIIDLDE